MQVVHKPVSKHT